MSTLPRFALVVPVKTLRRAKSRLLGLPDEVRHDLVLAFALDAVAAALACPAVQRVTVVTDEPDLADLVQALGCDVLADEGAGDLNAALRAAVRRLAPGPVAAMLGDLPCLVPGDLEEALGEVRYDGFVADADGTGTTLLAVDEAWRFDPRFGTGSRDAHRAAGVTELEVAVPTLRRDVDTSEDLAAARALGLGPRSAAVLA